MRITPQGRSYLQNIQLPKGSLSSMSKTLTKQLREKPDRSKETWTRDLNRHFIKEQIQMTKKHIEGMVNFSK